MKNKKSFVLYTDYQELFNELSDEDAGQLIKHIFSYVNDENPKTENPFVKLSFIAIKKQFKRDLVKWEKSAERSRENGKLGGRPPKPKETQVNPDKPSGLINNPDKPRKPDNVTVTVTDTVNVNVNDIVIKEKKPLFEKWISYRKELKKPIKIESTLKALIKKFNLEPLAKIEWVVNHSIENTYQGLIWDKYKPSKNGQQPQGAKHPFFDPSEYS